MRISVSSSKPRSPHLHVMTRAKIQSMILNEIVDFHVNHLFHTFGEHVDTKIEDVFATGFIRNSKPIRQELNAKVFEAVEDTIRDRQDDYAI